MIVGHIVGVSSHGAIHGIMGRTTPRARKPDARAKA
jgi:hypothetical protein